MLRSWREVPELRPHSQQPTTLRLTNHAQMALVCLEAVLINYVDSYKLYVVE